MGDSIDLAALPGVIAGSQVVILTTLGQDRWLHSRPLPLIDIDAEGELWFIIERNGRLCEELIVTPRVAVITTASGEGAYVAVSGRAIIIDNPTLLRELWREAYRCWFPRDVQEAQLVVMCVAARNAETWTGIGYPIDGDET